MNFDEPQARRTKPARERAGGSTAWATCAPHWRTNIGNRKCWIFIRSRWSGRGFRTCGSIILCRWRPAARRRAEEGWVRCQIHPGSGIALAHYLAQCEVFADPSGMEISVRGFRAEEFLTLGTVASLFSSLSSSGVLDAFGYRALGSSTLKVVSCGI
jgi:hypothetical protein